MPAPGVPFWRFWTQAWPPPKADKRTCFEAFRKKWISFHVNRDPGDRVNYRRQGDNLLVSQEHCKKFSQWVVFGCKKGYIYNVFSLADIHPD
jgi:hypothetical protein